MFDNWDDTTEVCPDLAKLNHFSQILEAVGYILRAYFARCKIMNLDVYAFWQIIIDVSSQFFEKYSSRMVTLDTNLLLILFKRYLQY